MVINISFSNKTFYLLVGILVFSVTLGLVYAYGGNQPSEVGHTINEINWNCTVHSNTTSLITATYDCPEGKMITGGCSVQGGPSTPLELGYEDLVASYPSGNGWTCGSSHVDRPVKVFVYCCK